MLPRRTFVLCLVLVGVTANMLPAESPQKVVSIEGITEYQLDNGLKVLLFPDQSRPKVTVNLTIFVGSRHEGYGEAGMAHLLEHMVFKGTPDHPQVPKALQERGAVFNGTTWLDRTNYYETLTASDENLEFAIRLEADRMMNSFIKGEDLASEMTVVRNEFERGENSPGSILRQRITAAAFEWHNYGQSTIGNRSDIERVPLPKLRDFYRRYYQPDNAMLVIAGKFDESKALEYTQKYFGSIPRPERKLDKTYTEEPPQDGQRTVELRRVGTVAMVGASYHIPSGAHPEYAAVDVLGYILAIEPAGRLYKELVETKLASSIVGGTYALHDPGMLSMMIEVRDLDRIDEAREKMLAEIEKIGTEGVTEDEVKRVQQQVLSQRERSLSNTSQLAINLSEWAAQGDWRLFFLYRDRIEKVTAADVKAAAEKYLRSSNRTVGTFIPSERTDKTPIPTTPDIAAMVQGYEGRAVVASGEQFDASPENIESRTVRFEVAGVKAALLSKKTRGEEVTLRLRLRYGDLESLKGYNAACAMLPRLMNRGTAELSFQELKDELDKNRATLSAGTTPLSANLGVATFSVTTKRPYLKQTLMLLKQVLRQPSLPKSELDVLQRELLAALEKGKTEPGQLASIKFRQLLAPYDSSDVRYVPSIDEVVNRIASVTLEQVQELYNSYLGAEGEIVMIGDFDENEVRTLLDDMFADWKAEKQFSRIPQQTFDVAGSEHSILTPDKANAVFYGGLTAPVQDDADDYPALVIANYIYGGGSLSSRLGDRIRQKEGLSYGVGSMFSASSLDPFARMAIYAISNPENSPKVAEGIQQELELLLEKGVTAEELERAKNGYLESQAVTRTNDGQLASRIASDMRADRTMLYQAELEKKIRSLTPEDVASVARKYFSPDKLIAITAGDFEKE